MSQTLPDVSYKNLLKNAKEYFTFNRSKIVKPPDSKEIISEQPEVIGDFV